MSATKLYNAAKRGDEAALLREIEVCAMAVRCRLYDRRLRHRPAPTSFGRPTPRKYRYGSPVSMATGRARSCC